MSALFRFYLCGRIAAEWLIDMAKEKRFVKTYGGGFESNEIWVDRETGVNYLYHSGGYGGGLTVLVDREGKPILTPIPRREE